jgi:hypothetical protein
VEGASFSLLPLENLDEVIGAFSSQTPWVIVCSAERFAVWCGVVRGG